MNKQVVFLNAPTPQAKLERIVTAVQDHFQKLERLLILVPNVESAQFIDTLLWKSPEEGFIPHQITEAPCETPVVITRRMENFNKASVLLTLLPEIPPFWKDFSLIYELMDETHPQKLQLSRSRLQTYQGLASVVVQPSSHLAHKAHAVTT